MSEYSLPEKYSQVLQAFESHLSMCAAHLPEAGETGKPESSEAQSMREKSTQALQQYFASKIQGLTEDELEDHGISTEVRSRFRSIHIELQRQMRLLQTDLFFLRSAKQPQTKAQRIRQIRERLTSLMNYCVLLKGEEP